MSISDTLLILILIALMYMAVILKLIEAAVERIAATSHYPQAAPFRPSIRADKAPTAPKVAGKPIKDSRLVDITDVSDELALAALENWKPES